MDYTALFAGTQLFLYICIVGVVVTSYLHYWGGRD